MIVEKIDEAKQKKISVHPVHTWRASALGHPCLRKLYLARTEWEKATLPDCGLQYIFDEGNHQEEVTITDLREAGFKILQAQRDFEEKSLGITAHIDFQLPIDGKIYPVEAKGLNPYDWAKLSCLEDFKTSGKWYIRGYVIQATLYLYFTNAEEGFILIRNKSTARYKEIPIKLDLELIDEVFAKVKKLNEYLAKKETPPRMNFVYEICNGCAFEHICMPEYKMSSTFQLIQSEELESAIKAREGLADGKKAYDAADKLFKNLAKPLEKEVTVVGNYVITKKESSTLQKAKPETILSRTTITVKKLVAGDTKAPEEDTEEE